jgi:sugar phosphate isomerase/epimerase
MQLGFVTAILPEWLLQDVLSFAAAEGFRCVEVMCWPMGKAERRYAGVTHLDVASFGEHELARTQELIAKSGVQISSFGYYPNPLCADPSERATYAEHLRLVIAASARLGIGVMTTFIGRGHLKSFEENWKLFESVWKPLISFADDHDVKVGIENCPMLFSDDEWPGGKNLAISPQIWLRMFDSIPSRNFGLNFDPFIWFGRRSTTFARSMSDRRQQTAPKVRRPQPRRRFPSSASNSIEIGRGFEDPDGDFRGLPYRELPGMRDGIPIFWARNRSKSREKCCTPDFLLC